MTKEEYQNDRVSKRVNSHAAWEMYLDHNEGRNKIDMTEFLQLFPMWMKMMGSNCRKYFEYYDKKFEIE